MNNQARDFKSEIETEYKGESDITLLWIAVTNLQERVNKLERKLSIST